jgi:hypothetical protein
MQVFDYLRLSASICGSIFLSRFILKSMKTPTFARSSTFAALGVAVVAAGLLFWQRQRHQEEIQSLQAQIQPERTPSRNPAFPAETSGTARSPGKNSAARRASSAAALGTILAQADPAARIRALLAFADEVPTGEIAAAIQQLRGSSPDWDPDTRAAIHLLLTRWAREAPDQALASLQTLDPTKQGGDATSILAGIAATDPQRAVKWLNDPANRMTAFPLIGQFLAGSIAKEWARQDPEAAVDWASKLPDSQRTGAYIGLMGTLASTDPRTASTLVARLEDGGPRREAIRNIATAWAKQAPVAAMDWAQSLAGEDRKSAMNEALGSWASHQPQDAAKYLEKTTASEITAAQLKAVAEPWLNQAPAAAAAWVATRPAGDARNEAMSGVIWRWTMTEPVAASAWLRAQPAGPTHDAGIAGLALATFDTDPSSALTWAASIADETKRAESIAIGMTEWLKRDSTAAREWAATNNIPVP